MADSQVKERESMGRARSQPDQSTFKGRFGALLRSLREKKDMSVENFRDKMEENGNPVSISTIYSWEVGTRAPNLETLPAIAKSLNCSIHDLIPPK